MSNADLIATWFAAHTPSGGFPTVPDESYCGSCREIWPCDDWRIAHALETAEKEVARLQATAAARLADLHSAISQTIVSAVLSDTGEMLDLHVWGSELAREVLAAPEIAGALRHPETTVPAVPEHLESLYRAAFDAGREVQREFDVALCEANTNPSGFGHGPLNSGSRSEWYAHGKRDAATSIRQADGLSK